MEDINAEAMLRTLRADILLLFEDAIQHLYTQKSELAKLKLDEVYGWKFTNRTLNRLSENNILTVGDLLKESEASLLSIRLFGRKSLNEVKYFLDNFKLCLRSYHPDDFQLHLHKNIP